MKKCISTWLSFDNHETNLLIIFWLFSLNNFLFFTQGLIGGPKRIGLLFLLLLSRVEARDPKALASLGLKRTLILVLAEMEDAKKRVAGLKEQ